MPRRNASGRFVKGGGGRRSRRSRGHERAHRRPHHKVHTVSHVASGLMLVQAANSPASDGTSVSTYLRSGDYGAASNRLQQAWLAKGGALSSNSYYAPAQSAAKGAVGIFVAGKLIGWLVPSLKRTFRIGKFHVRLVE